VPWSVPLDTDDEHARYDRGQVVSYFAAATRAALILAAFKGALPGPVDAGQCLVGLVRPGGEPVLWPVGRACVGGLHHAQRHGRARDRGRMVAW
jgi:hypothetical protein